MPEYDRWDLTRRLKGQIRISIWKIFRSIYSVRHWENELIKLLMHDV